MLKKRGNLYLPMRMKFKKKHLIICAIIFLVLAGGIIFLNLNKNNSEELGSIFENSIIQKASYNPNNENDIGYEFLNSTGGITNYSASETVHIWNTQDDYFFNKSSGIQLTNHYNDYWTRNIFCIGYYNATGNWNKIRCADELENFNITISTDNSTYVNATLWKDFSYNGYDLRLGIRYHLKTEDKNLSVIIYAKNIGEDIPPDLGFAWKITDWNIPPTTQDDRITINNTNYFLNGTYNLEFENMDESYLRGYDIFKWVEEFLRLDWNENLDYKLKMYGDGDQSTFYTALLINGGHFDPDQEKQTILYWIDAVALGTSAGFVETAPVDDPGGSAATQDATATAFRDVSPATATKITEVGWWCEDATEEANWEFGLYTNGTGDLPDTLIHSTTTNAKGTTAGWKNASVNWDIDPDTVYWIAIALENTATTTRNNYNYNAAARGAYMYAGDAGLPADWSGASTSTNYYAFYVVWGTGGGGDVANPTVALNEPADATNYTSVQDVIFNCTVFDDVAVQNVTFYWNVSGTFEANGTDSSGTNNTKYSFTRAVSSEGHFVWNCLAFDTSSNYSYAATNYTFNLTITADTTAPTFTDIPSNVSGNYLTTNVNADFNWTDETAISMIFINDTSNFTMDNSTGILTNKTPLFVGNYSLNVTINDSSNNINWTIFTIQVNKSSNACQVLFNETSPIIFPAQFQAYSDCDSDFTLYLNGSAISNDSVVDSGAGTYNISVQRTDLQNYSNTFDDEYFVVSQAVPTGSISGTASITYGTAGDIEGTENNIQDEGVTYELYRNGTLVSNPDTSTLAVGFYSYIYNATAGQNYTANASMDTFNLTINQNADVCGVYFNASSPINYPETFIVYTNCSSAYILSQNGSAISNGTEVISGAGTFNFSVQRTDTINYSSTYYDEFFVVNKGTLIGSLSGTSPIENGTAGDVTGSETNNGDGDLTYLLYRNGTEVSNPDTDVLDVATYFYIYNSTGGANWTSNSSIDTFQLIVQDTIAPTIIVQSPLNATYINGTNSTIFFNATINESTSQWIVNYNGTNVSITINTTLDVEIGFHNAIFYANDSSGNTGVNNTIYFSVTAEAGDTTPPTFTTIPSNVSEIYGVSWEAVFEATDETAFGYYSMNDSRFTINQTGFLTNASGIPVGNYAINVSINDTAGNTNQTIFIAEITQNDSICGVYFNASSGITFPETFIVYTNCSSAYTLSMNGTSISNATEIISGAGAYNFSVLRTDSSNYSSYYNEEEFQVAKATLSASLTSTKTFSYEYDNSATIINLSESNTQDSDVNYTIYRDNATYIPDGESANFPVGTYPYILNSTGGQNYSSNANLDYEVLTITQNTETCQVLFNETSPITYPQTFLVWANCSSAFTLYQNGSTIANNSEVISGAGAFNFSFIRTDSSNYSTYYNETQFIVSQAIPNGTLTGTSPITYGTANDITGSESNSGDGDLDYKLYRNLTEISNPDTETLAVGFYSYIYNATAGQNYTANASMDTFNLTINQATGVVYTYLNNSRANLTLIQGTSIWLNGSLMAGQFGSLNLSINDSSLNYSTTENTTDYYNFSTAGLFKISTNYSGNQNYTSVIEEFFVTVQSSADTTPPTYSGNSVNNTYASNITLFSLTVDDNGALESAGNYTFSTNNTGSWANDSEINFTATPQTINATKILNETIGNLISYRWYLYDNAGNLNVTEIFSITVTAGAEAPSPFYGPMSCFGYNYLKSPSWSNCTKT